MIPDERIQILIVEDEAILAMELSDSLEAEGYCVVGLANNGRKALDLFQRQRVDLVLCDITIQGNWDGVETVRQLTNERPVPIIYLTALTDRATLERAKLTYPGAYLTKPYQLPALRTAIELAILNFIPRDRPAGAPLPAPNQLDRETLLQIDDALFVKQNYQFIKITLADLLYIEADNMYTTLVTTGRKYVLRLPLTTLMERINMPALVRIHRSYAVNVHRVDAFSDAEVSVGLQQLPLSRNHKDAFLRQFQFR